MTDQPIKSIFIVNDWEGNIFGVFSTYEKAINKKKQIENDENFYGYCRIQKFDVDSE